MRIWKEKTRNLHLGKLSPQDPEGTFDEILLRMTPQEDYSYHDFFLRMQPRVANAPSSTPTIKPQAGAAATREDGPPIKRFRLNKTKGAGGGGAAPKPKAKGKPKPAPKKTTKPFSLWKGARKNIEQANIDKAKQQEEQAEKDWKSKRPCFFYKQGKCERDPCPFLHDKNKRG